MKNNTLNDLGKIRVHKKVIASIALIAAKEIEGVVKIGGDTKTAIFNFLGDKNNTGSIDVELDKNGDAAIRIPVVIKYGFSLPDVAAKIQENVRLSVERMTDVAVKDVNVDIQSVEK